MREARREQPLRPACLAHGLARGSGDALVEAGKALPGDRRLERFGEHAHGDKDVTHVWRAKEGLAPGADRVTALLRGEGAVYARTGAPLPEVTALLGEADPAAAVKTVDALVAGLGGLAGIGPAAETQVGGVTAKRVSLGRFPLYYAAVGNRLVITDATTGITGGVPLAPKFSSDPVFRAARDAAGMPDEMTGFVFINLHDTIPLLERLGASVIPAPLAANLRPLQAVLAYGTADGDTLSARLFLQVS